MGLRSDAPQEIFDRLRAAPQYIARVDRADVGLLPLASIFDRTTREPVPRFGLVPVPSEVEGWCGDLFFVIGEPSIGHVWSIARRALGPNDIGDPSLLP